MQVKISLFEFFLKRLVEWYCDYYSIETHDFNNHVENDLSKIKIIKLHFFASSTDPEALDTFDNFHALPYGHVESDVYDNLKSLTHFTVNNSKLTVNSPLSSIVGVTSKNYIIDNMIENLKEKNYDLIATSPFELVELSHRWFSWNFTFQEARRIGSFSRAISPNLIKQEVKYYSY